MATISKVLIANRGEIACRIIRTARRLGVQAVAVYSDADAHALHVEMADEARRIGPPPARESYLDIDAVLTAARLSGADAVHPGYGFLSENAAFAEACAAAGIIFIGPPAPAIRAMGDKSAAKALMEQAGVPLVPGYHGEAQDAGTLAREAERIGYPVLIKASAGGGGKGMKVAAGPEEIEGQIASARREALSAFDCDRLLIEKYLQRPRHVEIQVFADRHGRVIHLFERDCSIQRRHQKVIEEAPAPHMPPLLRRRMGEAAVAVARAVGYEGAGTVEFLLDAEGGFYFMEMNTRLQVEHPVTELITGQDLVEWQFRVAAGEPLPLGQDDLVLRGHAIEARLYAEDVERDFLPQTGRLEHLRFPAGNGHVRIDAGVREGDAISIHYDPMIAKMIVWDADRPAALRRLRTLLAETHLVGLPSNLRFLEAIAAHPAFIAADLDTGFIDRHKADLLPKQQLASARELAFATLGVLLERANAARDRGLASADAFSPWNRTDGWRLNEQAAETLSFREAGQVRDVRVVYGRAGYELTLPGGERLLAHGEFAVDGTLDADFDGARLSSVWVRQGNDLHIFHSGGSHRLSLVDPLALAAAGEASGERIEAPMPGRITAVLVEAGADVERGHPLVVMEAMKMEHTIKAVRSGTVRAVRYAPGDQVEEGALLVEFAEAET